MGCDNIFTQLHFGAQGASREEEIELKFGASIEGQF
jgi:hypothetical protein